MIINNDPVRFRLPQYELIDLFQVVDSKIAGYEHALETFMLDLDTVEITAFKILVVPDVKRLYLRDIFPLDGFFYQALPGDQAAVQFDPFDNHVRTEYGEHRAENTAEQKTNHLLKVC